MPKNHTGAAARVGFGVGLVVSLERVFDRVAVYHATLVIGLIMMTTTFLMASSSLQRLASGFCV